MTHKCLILAGSVSILALSGCASMGLDRFAAKSQASAPPQAELPAAPTKASSGEEQWAGFAPDRLPDTNWANSFGDAQLANLIEEGLAANTDVRAAAFRLQAAEASAAASRSGLYPSLSASGRASRTETLDMDVPGITGFGLDADVSWEADVWGRVRDGADAGDIEAAASNADYAAVRLSIAGAISQAWFDLVEARQQADLAQRNVVTQQRALRLTKRRFDGGVSGSSDYRLARSAVASAEARLASQEQLKSATARRLETLLRRYPANELQTPTQLPALPPLVGAGAPRDIFLRRPDLLAAERRMSAAGLRLDIAEKNLLPRLTLTGGLGTGAGSLGRLFSFENLASSIAGGVVAPIFEGGALRAEVARNEAVVNQQLEAYADTALTAYLEVENALDAERLLETRERALQTSLDESRKAEERLELRFSEGLASILQLLDAQSRRINAEGQLIAAKKERLANRVRLHLALGGGIYGRELDRAPIAAPKFPLPKLPQRISLP